MSTEYPTHFVQQYKNNIIHLSQQKGSRLFSTVTVKENVTGKQCFFDRLGLSSMTQITNRHGDTVITDTPHSRRLCSMAPYEKADLVDEQDTVRALINPTNPYAKSQGMAAGRTMDDVIIAAAFGTSKSGETGSTEQTWAQAIAADSTLQIGVQVGGGGSNAGLTLEKIIDAKRYMDAAEVDDMDRYFVLSSVQLNKDLMVLEKFTSADYVAGRTLSNGDLPRFMGFQFVRSERLGTDASGYRRCMAYAGSALGLAIGDMQKTRIDELPNKRYATQVYTNLDLGATRIEDEKIREILCDETV